MKREDCRVCGAENAGFVGRHDNDISHKFCPPCEKEFEALMVSLDYFDKAGQDWGDAYDLAVTDNADPAVVSSLLALI